MLDIRGIELLSNKRSGKIRKRFGLAKNLCSFERFSSNKVKNKKNVFEISKIFCILRKVEANYIVNLSIPRNVNCPSNFFFYKTRRFQGCEVFVIEKSIERGSRYITEINKIIRITEKVYRVRSTSFAYL